MVDESTGRLRTGRFTIGALLIGVIVGGFVAVVAAAARMPAYGGPLAASLLGVQVGGLAVTVYAIVVLVRMPRDPASGIGAAPLAVRRMLRAALRGASARAGSDVVASHAAASAVRRAAALRADHVIAVAVQSAGIVLAAGAGRLVAITGGRGIVVVDAIVVTLVAVTLVGIALVTPIRATRLRRLARS